MSERIANSHNDKLPLESKARRFMDLIVSNQKKIFAYILSIISNHADAEDLLQETLAIMWEKFDSYEAGTDFAAWGVAIARFRILNFRKKHKAFLSNEVIEILEQETAERLDGLDDQLDILKECIKKLSLKDKKLLKMRYERDLTFEKIAGQFGLTASGICRAISRTHLRLTQCLRRNRNWEATS